MKNLFKVLATQSRWLCAIALAAVIGFSMAGCASTTVVSIEEDAVGPERVGQGQTVNPKDVTVYGMYKDGNRKTVSVREVILDTSTPGP